jgi:hypothetical protein
VYRFSYIKTHTHNVFWGISSVGQSTCLARRGSRVRLPYSPQNWFKVQVLIFKAYNIWVLYFEFWPIRFFDILAIIIRVNKIKFEKVIKSVWWMPRLSEAKKDVTSCENLWGGANIRYIRRYPNGATRHAEGVTFRHFRKANPEN